MAVAHRPALMATARSLSIDRVAAEVTRALEERGVDCMLVKGAAVTRALYADGAPRAYGDCDILVQRADVSVAHAVLASLGFANARDGDSLSLAEVLHSHTCYRARDGATVDLHWTFAALEAAAETVWAALRPRAVPARVGGRELAAADTATTVLLSTLQLLQHGPSEGAKFRVDVERALEGVDQATWDAAAELATEIGVEPSFGAGLRMVPGGSAAAARLGLPDDAVMRELVNGPGALGEVQTLEMMARRSGVVAKLRLFAWLLLPPRAYLEMQHPSARRGGLRLAALYAWRPVSLAVRAPATLAAWRRARSAADV